MPKGAPKIAALILAAGFSHRMRQAQDRAEEAAQQAVGRAVSARNRGSAAEKHKLLIPLRRAGDAHAHPVLAHVLHRVMAVDFAEILLVLGPEAERIQTALRPSLKTMERLRMITHQQSHHGLSRSLQAGLKALSPTSEAVMVFLGDMPGITTALIQSVRDGYAPDQQSLICQPVFQDSGQEGPAPDSRPQPGHPILWDARFFPDLMAIDGDQGGRSVLRRFPHYHARIPTSEWGAILDVDDLQALAKIKEKCGFS